MLRLALARPARPDLKPTVMKRCDFPRAPDALALAEAAIRHVVPPDVGLRPRTFQARRVVLAADDERPDVVVALASHPAFAERQVQIHAMLVLRAVVVEPSPRA